MGAVVAFQSRHGPPDREIIRRMLMAAPHRGASAELRTHGNVALGISTGSEQKDAWLAVADGHAAGVMGAIDNRADLAKRLAAGGALFGSDDPATLLIAAFRVWGDQAPGRLRGAFAAIITDGSQVWALRDHLGFKPLFYRQDEGRLFLASEAKQVVAGAGIPAEPDLEVLERIVYNRLDNATPCALRGVRRLPKASLLHVRRDGRAATSKYWNPEELLETARPTEDELQARFDEVMARAVSRMLSDGSVISLSGGIDSTAVAAFAAGEHLRRTGRPLAGLSLVFPDLPRVDEREYIEMVAKFLRMPLHTYRPAARHLDRLSEWVRLTDGPPMASVNESEEHYRRARSLGFHTILTGDLAEFVYDMRTHLMTHLTARRRYAALWHYLTAPRPTRASRKSMLRQIAAAFVPAMVSAAYVRHAGLERNPNVPDWLEERKVNEVPYRTDLRTPPARRWTEQQLVVFSGPGIGEESDEICATICGVQVRKPLLDVDLWEFFLTLPAEVKYPDARPKTLVRRLLRGKLPDAILDRPNKTYFDDFVMSMIDYGNLRRWLVNPSYRIDGVKYDVLESRLAKEDFTLRDFAWAKDLAAVHAFLNLW